MGEAKTRKVHPGVQGEGPSGGGREVETINEIGQEYGVHPVQVGQWKDAPQKQARTLLL